MLGALEVKRVTRVATERGPAWKSIHTAVLSCLLAHRNHKTGHCWPARAVIARFCRSSERTVDRAIAKLIEWGAIERQQPRALAGGTFAPVQYAFLFELPPCDKNASSRATKTQLAVRQKPRRNKEEAKDLEQAQRSKASGGRGSSPRPGRFQQSDFDERDLRLLGAANRQFDKLREASVGAFSHWTEESIYAWLSMQAGLMPARIKQLEEQVGWAEKSKPEPPLPISKAEQRKRNNLEVNARVQEKLKAQFGKGGAA